MNVEQVATEAQSCQPACETREMREQAPTPFHCFSWEEWLGMQTKMLHAFSRFQYAITERRVDEALTVADEVITMGVEWMYEARQWLNHKDIHGK